MTGEEFDIIYRDTELRQFIVDRAKRRSRRQELQEEYYQEAWLAISCAPADHTNDSYRELANKAIYSAYWQNRKEYMLTSNIKRHLDDYRHKIPEQATDNDTWFMQENNWRD